MRTPSSNPDRREMRVNMTPMIDVVFLLIIFFLVSSHLARQESQLPLPLPTAESGQEVVEDRDRVVVNLLSDGTMRFAGRNVNASELQRRLVNEVATGKTDLEVRIRSDRDVPYQFVQPILSAIAKARVNNVTFAVTRPQ